MNLDPNWVGAIGQWAGAGATVAAVIVALREIVENRKQSHHDRYDASRPVLVVSSHHDKHEAPVRTQPGLPNWLDWNNPIQPICIKNVGTGTAFNIVSVLYGPESLAKDNQSLDASSNDHWKRAVSSLSVNECGLCDHHRGSSMFFNGYTEIIDGYRLLAPSQPLNYATTLELACICRVTITYQDVFKRKHASVFDLDVTGSWTMRKVSEDISCDFRDLEDHKSPVLKVPLLKRFRRRH